MRLLFFKVDSDYDNGALMFEKSGTSISDVYQDMQNGDATIVEDEDGDWRVELIHRQQVNSKEEADKYLVIASTVAEVLGDYDNRKNADYLTLLVED